MSNNLFNINPFGPLKEPPIKNLNGLSSKQGVNFQALQMDIDFDLSDTFTEVSWTQKYVNNNSNSVEAIYSLLLPLNTAITKFIVIYDGKRIAGVVKEAEEAANTYDDALSSGNSGFLVEKSKREDVNQFNISIGNIPSGKEVSIEISFLALLTDRLNGKLEFEIPLELIPKDLSGVSIRGNVSLVAPFQDLKVNHGTVNGSAVVYQGRLSNDFVLSLQLLSSLFPYAVLESDLESKSQAVMITHYPEFPDSSSPFFEPKIDAVFVVDRSGSMSGDRIQKTCSALNVLIHALPSDSYFNIVGFGSREDWLFPESVPYNQSNLMKAESLISKMPADLGGTNLLTPLRSVFAKPKIPDYPRVLFVLTDGEVDDRESVIAEVKRNKDCFLYGFGIGDGVDHILVNGIAQAGRGKAEFVNSTADIEKKVISLFQDALKPALSQLKIDWGCPVTQVPKDITAVMQGTRLVVFGFIKSGMISEKIILSGKNEEGNPLICPIQITQRKGNTIHKIAAYHLINELYLSKNNNTKSEIIELGLKYQLATKYTSFVASADNDSATNDLQVQEIKLLKPVELPKPQINFLMHNLVHTTSHSTSTTSYQAPQQQPIQQARSGWSQQTQAKSNSQNLFSAQPVSNTLSSFDAFSPTTTSSNFFGGSSTSVKNASAVIPNSGPDRYAADFFSFYSSDGGSKQRSSPKGAASSDRYSAKSASLSDDQDLFGASNLFGGSQQQNTSNLFAASSISGSSSRTKSASLFDDDEDDLFGSKQQSTSNPFGGSQQQSASNTYGGSQQQSASNPFGGSQQQSTSNPFGGSQQQSASNPFGGSSSTGVYPITLGSSSTGGSAFGGSDPWSASGGKASVNSASLFDEDEDDLWGSKSSKKSTTTSKSQTNIKNQIVSSQQFDGCWEEQAIRSILNYNNTQVALYENPKSPQKIWITALAIAILEVKCQEDKSTWEIVANKAKTFMSKYLLTQEKMAKDKIISHVNQLIETAKEVIRKLHF